MIALIIFCIVAFGLPFLVIVLRKNFWTLLLSYCPSLLLTFFYVQHECTNNRASEACVWGYINYAIALFSGGVLYLLFTLIQSVISRKKGNGESKNILTIVIMWILCVPVATFTTWVIILIMTLVESSARLTTPIWLYALIGFPIFVSTVWGLAPVKKWVVALGAYIFIAVLSFSFLFGITKSDSVTPDFLPMIAGYSSGAAIVFLIWFLSSRDDWRK